MMESSHTPTSPVHLDPQASGYLTTINDISDHSDSETSPITPTAPTPFLIPATDGLLRDPETVGTLIEISSAEGKGFGVFALVDIPPDTVILAETPLVTLVDTGTRADPLELAVNSLSPERKVAFRALHSFKRTGHETEYRSIMYSNGFAIGETATGIFEIASRINHSWLGFSSLVGGYGIDGDAAFRTLVTRSTRLSARWSSRTISNYYGVKKSPLIMDINQDIW